MDFYFENSIWVEEVELEEIVSRVKDGENFEDVYNDIVSGWDDLDYYTSHFIKNDVKKEILKRIKNNI